MADGSNFTAYYIAESSFGVTPSPIDGAPLSWKPLSLNGFTIAQSRQAIEGTNIKSGRFSSKPVLGGIEHGGDISTELPHGEFDDFIEAALGGTWTTNVLKAGATRRSFSIAGHHSDLNGANKYRLHKGVNVNTWNLTVSTDAVVTSTFGCIGKSEEFTDLSTDSFDAVGTANPFDSFSGSVKENNVTLGIVTETSFTVDNGMERRPTIMTGTDASEPSIGLSKVTGNFTVYFESADLYEKYLNSTDTSIEFTITNADGSYTFLMADVRFTGGQPDIQGPGAITLPLSFEASYDAVEQTNLKVTRV